MSNTPTWILWYLPFLPFKDKSIIYPSMAFADGAIEGLKYDLPPSSSEKSLFLGHTMHAQTYQTYVCPAFRVPFSRTRFTPHTRHTHALTTPINLLLQLCRV